MPRSTVGSGSDTRDDVGRGVLAGLMPLIRLVVVFALALALPTLARFVLSTKSFATQQAVDVIGVAVMLLVAVIVYGVSLSAALRRTRGWRETGRLAQATAALWTLTATALIAALPVIVAVLWPQHPAP